MIDSIDFKWLARTVVDSLPRKSACQFFDTIFSKEWTRGEFIYWASYTSNTIEEFTSKMEAYIDMEEFQRRLEKEVMEQGEEELSKLEERLQEELNVNRDWIAEISRVRRQRDVG